MARAAVAPIHPKLLAVMQPRGSSRGKSRKAEGQVETAVEATAYVPVDFVPAAPPVDPTKKAADAFAASHPEGTKALLARLLKERAEAAELTPDEAAREAKLAMELSLEAREGGLEPIDREPVTVNVGAHTREGWMLAAVEAMRSWLPEGHVVPEVRISFGWPGGRGSKKGVRGQCWYTTDDKAPAIFVSPDQNDPTTVLAIILHEMVHASGQANHKPSGFGKVAGPMGFSASFTTSENRNEELTARLAELAGQLGPIDHSRVNNGTGLYGGTAARPPVQTTRMVKVTCPVDGYTVRTTRKWLAVGIPSCPCGAEMQADESELALLEPAPGAGEDEL